MEQPNNNSKRPYPVKAALALGICLVGGLLIYGLISLFSSGVHISGPSYLAVCVIEADPDIPGKVFAQLGDYSSRCDEYGQLQATYETDDYGQSWHRLTNPPPEWSSWHQRHTVASFDSNGNGRMWLDGKIVWTLPRAEFRQLVDPSASSFCSSCLVMSSVAPTGQGVLYAALGPYGVLVGPDPAEPGQADRAWHLVHDDFAGLDPSLFRLTAPQSILFVVFFFLVVPPLPWIHAWLLNQAWRYMVPADEQHLVTRLTWRVSFALTALAALALAFWLYDADANVGAVAGTVTAITVATGVIVSVRTARRRQFTDAFTRKMAIGTAALSLIVPAAMLAPRSGGITGIGDMIWPSCVLLLMGFAIYRGALNRYFERFHSRTTLWQLDRLTLEILGLFLVMLVPLGLVTVGAALLLANLRFITVLSCIPCLIPVVGVPFLGTLALTIYTRWRGRGIVIKKKELPLELHDTPLFADNRWFTMLFTQTLIWLGTTVGVWFAFFLAEGLRWSWPQISGL